MSGALPADHEARVRALDPNQSFIVQAPAGSGKTELLVRRHLTLLTGVARPEAVLSVTFTRKAAGEMRERILKQLRLAAAGEEPDAAHAKEGYRLAQKVLERSAELGWNLIDNPSRLAVSTIDGLASSLAHSLPMLSGSGPELSVTEDPRSLFVQAARRALASEAPAIREAVNLLAERGELRLGSLEEQIVSMLARREQWAEGIAAGVGPKAEELLDRVEAGFAAVIEKTIEQAEAALGEDFAAQAEEFARLSRANFEAEGKECLWPSLGDTTHLTEGSSTATAWSEAASMLLTTEGFLRKPGGVNKRVGAPPKSAAKDAGVALFGDFAELDEQDALRLAERIAAAGQLPAAAVFSEDGRATLGALFVLLLEAWGKLQLEFGSHQSVDFAEVSLRALEALRDGEDPSDLLLQLDRRIDHILVDEFQDTNYLQCRLLELLTSGWMPGDGRTLFLVGDPMQSIYRFRKAEVGLFVAARAGNGFFSDLKLEPLRLSVSFRSDRTLLAWVNETFAPLFGSSEDAATATVAYATFDPAPDAAEGPAVALHRWTGGAVDGEDQEGADPVESEPARDAEARGLAELIRGELDGTQTKIAVLVRTKTHAVPLMRELGEIGVSYSAAGVENLSDRTVVRDLDSLTHALLHPADRLAWLSFLRGPLVGLTTQDIGLLVEADVAEVARSTKARRDAREAQAPGAPATTELAQVKRLQSIPALLRSAKTLELLSVENRNRVERVALTMERARQEIGRRPLSAVVRGAWVALGGPLFGGVDDADAYLDALERACVGGVPDLEALTRRVEQLAASPEQAPDVRVEFLTMHGAKGLEFDTVILPRLEAGPRRDDKPALAVEANPETAQLSLIAAAPARGMSDPDAQKYDLVWTRERARAKAESLRLLYVAATRARHRLVLSAGATATKTGWAKANKNSLLGAADAALGEAFAVLEPARVVQSAAALPLQSLRVKDGFRWDDLPRPVAAVSRELVTATTKGLEEGLAADPMDRYRTFDPMAAAFGTVVHAWLDRIARQGLDRWSPEEIPAARARLARDFRMAGVVASKLDGEVARASALLTATLEDPQGRRILAAKEEARAEWPLVVLRGGKVLRCTIDRSFVEDGVRWIVDYKTATAPAEDAEGGTLDVWLAREREAHAAQLESYRFAVSVAQENLDDLTSGLPIRTALYYPAIPLGQRWVDVDL